MKQIPLTQGKVAMIDDCDFDLVSKHKWNTRKCRHTFYALCASSRKLNGGKQKTIYMHRLILDAKLGQCVDHKDRNGLNNCRDNIRICSNAQNIMNSRARHSKSGFRGVYWLENKKRFKAYICLNGKIKNIGHFHNKIDAAKAYNKCALKFHGEFASLNQFPE